MINSGKSDMLGFVIYDKYLKIEVKSRGRAQKWYTNRFLMSYILAWIVCISVEIICLGKAGRIWSFISISNGIISIAITTTFLYDIRDRTAQWHATEHKLITILDSDQPVTLENLKRASMKHNSCGTGNQKLKEPEEQYLTEAILVGQEYLRLVNEIRSKVQRFVMEMDLTTLELVPIEGYP